MARRNFQLYYGPADQPSVPAKTHSPDASQVTVPLGEVLAWLVEAANDNRGWLRDFHDDGITISADLYEILITSRRLRSSA